MAVAKAAGVRGSDRKKQDFEWVDVKVVQEYEEGWYLGYLDHPDDLATLGRLMGHCAGTHFVWACEEKVWYFFALFDKDGVPHGTLHAKEKKWLNTVHPRDQMPPIPQENNYCRDCNGAGGAYKAPGDWNAEYVTCKRCGGNGLDPEPVKDKIGAIRPSSGGYATFADVLAAFKAASKEYVPGMYRSLNYNSRTYDSGAVGRDYSDRHSFDALYPDSFGGKKPDGITDEIWAEYTKLYKKLKDEYNKNNGFVKIAGRVFKFDGKELIVLSWADKHQYGVGKSSYRKMVGEFLNACTKSKRVTTNKEESA